MKDKTKKYFPKEINIWKAKQYFFLIHYKIK